MFRLAQVGQPVPAEEALASDDQTVPIGRDRLEESSRLGGHFLVPDGGAAVVKDAQVHCPGVQIDPAVESVHLVVETHQWSPLGMGPGSEPVSWPEGTPFRDHFRPRPRP